MMEQIADRKLYIAKVREAIPGMTAGIIETLGLVIGLVGGPCPDTRHRTDRAHRDVRRLDRGNVRLLHRVERITVTLTRGETKNSTIKTEVSPAVLRRELESDLTEKGVKARNHKAHHGYPRERCDRPIEPGQDNQNKRRWPSSERDPSRPPPYSLFSGPCRCWRLSSSGPYGARLP